jgi:hypothetical protein
MGAGVDRLLRRPGYQLLGVQATGTMPLSVRAMLLVAVEPVSALTLPVLVVSFGAGPLKH